MQISQLCWQFLIGQSIKTGISAVPSQGYDTSLQLSEVALWVFQIVLQL